jgi:hypothetical protein
MDPKANFSADQEDTDMKTRAMGYSVVAAAVVCALSLVLVAKPAAQNRPGGQNGAQASSAPIPRTPDGHPDISGFWGAGGGNPTTNEDGSGQGALGYRASDGSVLFDFGGPNNAQLKATQSTNQPHYKPEYAAKVKELGDSFYGGSSNLDPMVQCKPLGNPRGSFGTMQIAQTPTFIAILFEEAMNDRIIYTDGRQHPKDFDSAYQGDSIGHWEGDTLVVDVAGLNDDTWYAGGVNSNQIYSTLHSDQEHVTERWAVQGDQITYTATVEDPVMLAEPWVINPRRVRRAEKGDYLLQYACNSTDYGHIVKPTATDQFKCVYGGTRPECH